MPRLPTGTVTFLFTDIEGSTRLLHELGAHAYAAALLEHRRVVRAAVAAYGGVEVDTQGDAFFVAFPTAAGAVRAAARVADDLQQGPIKLRMGVHTGSLYVTDEGYVGDDVHRAARIAACGHGGQVLVSSSTAALLPHDPLPGVPQLHDLGAHRLKDLSAAEHLHQLGDHKFPPLKSLHRTNLPVPATPFTGRGTELREVLDMLGRDDVRLLTLTGTGGTGKTRLALQAAGALAEHYPGGLFWVPLASLRDPSLVLGAASHALGTSDDLAIHIGDRAVLLLLDNVEQVIDVAPELVTLLAACPRLRLVVTSREVLRVQGEHVYPVPPLGRDDAVELFVARARAVEPAFTPTPAVADLCARLDRLPLAVELAAARTRVLTVDQLLDRLAQRLDLLKAGRGADPRQQTLRATIAWSHDLLHPDEQRLFARLAAFRGGCRLESAELVCDADLDVLQSLVDKSLVRLRDAGRFWMLETIREYAAEKLATSGEEATLRDRQAEHFLALAEEAAPHLRDRDAASWLARLDDEQDNLRAALEWYEARPGERLRLAAALTEFWLVRGFLTEGRRVLTAALAAAGNAADPSLLARGLDAAAMMAVDAGDAGTARAHAAAALAIHDRLGEDAGRAESLWLLGYVAVVDRDWPRAQQALEESVEIFRRLGDDAALLAVCRSLAWSHHERGDLETARRLHEQNLALATALNHPMRRAQTLGSLSTLATEQGRLTDAVPMLSELHEILDELGDLPGVVQNLARIVRVLVALDEPATAAVLLACAEDASRSIGGSEVWTAALNDESRRWVAERLDEAACLAARQRGSRLSPAQSARLGLELAVQRTR